MYVWGCVPVNIYMFIYLCNKIIGRAEINYSVGKSSSMLKVSVIV